MKPIYPFIFALTLLSTASPAQKRIVDLKRAFGKDHTYSVSRGDRTFVVRNERNNIRGPAFPKSLGNGDTPYVILYRTTKLDTAKLLANISAVFSPRRLRKMRDEKLILFLYFDDSGNLLEITFGMWPVSKLTVKEVNAIENRLKKNLKLKILTDDMKGSSFLPYGNIYYFRDLPEIK